MGFRFCVFRSVANFTFHPVRLAPYFKGNARTNNFQLFGPHIVRFEHVHVHVHVHVMYVM